MAKGWKRRKRWESTLLNGETPAQRKARKPTMTVSGVITAAELNASWHTMMRIRQGRPIWSTSAVWMPEPPPQPAPPIRHFVAGPTTGYRVWRIDEDGYLTGVSKMSRWPVHQPMTGDCWNTGPNAWFLGPPPPEHHEPHYLCTCGVYALNQPDFGGIDYLESDTVYVAGRVALWGRVIEYTKGYRAQYAYPEALWPHVGHGQRWLEPLLRLGERYGVPVFPEAA